jgi:hypothetical protein
MKFSAAHHLISYCRPSISKIPTPFGFAQSLSSSMVSALLILALTEHLERKARASLPVPMFTVSQLF